MTLNVLKGVASDLGAVILLGESAKLGNVVRDAITIGKEIVGGFDGGKVET